MEDGISGWVYFLLGAILVGVMIYCSHDTRRPEVIAAEQHAKELHQQECAKPKLITSVNGAELWAIHWCPDDRYSIVYFSKSGASWQTTEHYGKGQTRIIDHQTPNAEAQ